MANYSVAAGGVGSYENTMTASTVDTVTFADDLDAVEVMSHDGASAVYFTVDGSTPTVKGAGCWMLPASPSAVTVDVPTAAGTAVKLISVGTPTVSVSKASRVR